MKKMLLLLASLACFGLLASCSNDTQDVYVTNVAGVYYAAGVMEGTITIKYPNEDTSTTWTIDKVRYATVSSENTTAGVVSYYLSIPYTYIDGSKTKENITSVYISKIDGKYYFTGTSDYYNKGKSVKIDDFFEVDGSLEGDFTVTSMKTGENPTVTISNLKFTKK